MAADDLSAPLGRNPISKRKTLPVPPAILLAGSLGLVLAVFAGWALFVSDPQGGEPVATVALPPSTAIATKAEGGTPPDPNIVVANPQSGKGDAPGVVTIIDGSTGKRQEVQLPAPEAKPGASYPRLL